MNSCDDTQFLTLVVEARSEGGARRGLRGLQREGRGARSGDRANAELEFPEVMREYRAVREARKVAGARSSVVRASKPTTCRGVTPTSGDVRRATYAASRARHSRPPPRRRVYGAISP